MFFERIKVFSEAIDACLYVGLAVALSWGLYLQLNSLSSDQAQQLSRVECDLHPEQNCDVRENDARTDAELIDDIERKGETTQEAAKYASDSMPTRTPLETVLTEVGKAAIAVRQNEKEP